MVSTITKEVYHKNRTDRTGFDEDAVREELRLLGCYAVWLL
jgi:hypothetical protein